MCPQKQNIRAEGLCNDLKTPQEGDTHAFQKLNHVSYITKKINVVCGGTPLNKGAKTPHAGALDGAEYVDVCK